MPYTHIQCLGVNSSTWPSQVTRQPREYHGSVVWLISHNYISPDGMAIKPWYAICHKSLFGNLFAFFFSAWAIATNQSQKVFGVTLGGEFSTAINDCGLWFVNLPPDLMQEVTGSRNQAEWDWINPWLPRLLNMG